ncbi:hypothetical protein [Asanoa iriomotensis]|uniref:Uncharacterized protein n=1 Tax=Asanoa iriomotensis TaxID=234613 RepID=A0ABQ4CBR9_9ACTN|nr:hypothetical protein [Asanoa iriomotensis]GIF60226.1 hypothetical protein Air01nite_63210 [Asanoa iriomotensis]
MTRRQATNIRATETQESDRMTTRRPTNKTTATPTAEAPTDTIVVAHLPDQAAKEATKAALNAAREAAARATEALEAASDESDGYDDEGEPLPQPRFAEDDDLNEFLLNGRNEMRLARLRSAAVAASRAVDRAEKEYFAASGSVNPIGHRFAELVAGVLSPRVERAARLAGIVLGRITVESIPLDRGRTPSQDSRYGDTFGRARITVESRHLPALVPHGFIREALADVGAKSPDGVSTSKFDGGPTGYEYEFEGTIGDPVIVAKAEAERREQEHEAALASYAVINWSNRTSEVF